MKIFRPIAVALANQVTPDAQLLRKPVWRFTPKPLPRTSAD